MILTRAEEEITHVYFPDHAMISVVAYTEDGQSAEVGVIGFEGMTGVEAVLGGRVSHDELITQMPNGALRMSVNDIRREFGQYGAMHDAILNFVRQLLGQVSQTAICNRLHSTEMRLSRWLLICRDRSDSDVLNITQEFLATMLGASRTSVSIAATGLQDTGLIRYSRGAVRIVDRAALEEFTCSCYRSLSRMFSPVVDTDGDI